MSAVLAWAKMEMQLMPPGLRKKSGVQKQQEHDTLQCILSRKMACSIKYQLATRVNWVHLASL